MDYIPYITACKEMYLLSDIVIEMDFLISVAEQSPNKW